MAFSAVLAAALVAPVVPGMNAHADSSFESKQEVALPAAQLNFENINPAIRMATAYGDRASGPHGTFGAFPGNFVTSFHTHTGAYHGVVVKGTMTNPFKDEASPPELAAGSYWFVPAGSEHATACISAEPCEFFFFAAGGGRFPSSKLAARSVAIMAAGIAILVAGSRSCAAFNADRSAPVF
jgi:hypothetical protein